MARPCTNPSAFPDDQVIVSGMALGVEDKSAKANTLVTEREPVEGFTTFHV